MLKPLIISLFFSLLLSLAPQAAAQETREHEIGSRAFAFHDGAARKVTSTEASAEARAIVQRITSAIGLAANFEIRAAPGVGNAEAIVENGGKGRFILYNPSWMAQLKATLDDSWSETSVLAHEIGHHLQFHMDPDFGNHTAELQADRFSGFILNRLGAALAEAKLAMATIASDEDSETHPGRAKRLKAIAEGWNNADKGQSANVIKTPDAATDVVGAVKSQDATMNAPVAAPLGLRLALLIGNSNYVHALPLANPKNDVIAIQRELRKLGFSTTTLYDGTRSQIAEHIRLFREDAKDADWALFYFAGQGFEIDGINYMAPVDIEPDKWKSQDNADMRLSQAYDAVRGAKTLRLVIADACRDDPFANLSAALNEKNEPRVFKVTEPPHGVVVAYSTSAGKVALDGAGAMSPYSEAMIEALREPGIEFDKVFKRVSAKVAKATNNEQVPTVLGNWPPEDLYLSSR